MTMWKRFDWYNWKACCPSSASVTSNPIALSKSVTMFRINALSSATNTECLIPKKLLQQKNSFPSLGSDGFPSSFRPVMLATHQPHCPSSANYRFIKGEIAHRVQILEQFAGTVFSVVGVK
jgi:hypothetical protein